MEAIELKTVSEWGSAGPFERSKAASHQETILDRVDRLCKKEFESWRSFSFSAFFEANCTELAIGALAGVASFVLLGQFDAVLAQLGGALGGGAVGPIGCAIQLAQMPTTLVIGAVKVAFFAAFAFVIPHIEEFVFREVLHDLFGGDVGDKIDKGFKILGNALLFALYHIPAMLPHVSLLLLLEIFILGIVLAALRTLTEGRIASTAAHVTYNSLIFATIFAFT